MPASAYSSFRLFFFLFLFSFFPLCGSFSGMATHRTGGDGQRGIVDERWKGVPISSSIPYSASAHYDMETDNYGLGGPNVMLGRPGSIDRALQFKV